MVFQKKTPDDTGTEDWDDFVCLSGNDTNSKYNDIRSGDTDVFVDYVDYSDDTDSEGDIHIGDLGLSRVSMYHNGDTSFEEGTMHSD